MNTNLKPKTHICTDHWLGSAGAGEHLRPHFATLVRVAAAGLGDGAERVRAAALAAVATLVQWVAEEPEVKAFRELVPTMLRVGQKPFLGTHTFSV